MSTIQSSPTNVTEAKTRKPTLTEKYGKFVQFAYYMMDNILGEDFQYDKETYLEKIKLFGTVEEQQAMVQCFFDNATENKKTIKKTITDRKKTILKENKDIAKANKPVKQKQPRAKTVAAIVETTDVTDEDIPTPVTKHTRKPATKKAVQNAEEEILNELIQNIVETPEQTLVTEPVDTKKPKKVTKKVTKKDIITTTEQPDTMSVTNELVAEEFITETAEQVKPKRKKNTKKTDTNATTDAGILPPTTIPGSDIELSPITVSDTTYFKDNNSNLYNYPIPTSHSIGKYNTETNLFELA